MTNTLALFCYLLSKRVIVKEFSLGGCTSGKMDCHVRQIRQCRAFYFYGSLMLSHQQLTGQGTRNAPKVVRRESLCTSRHLQLPEKRVVGSCHRIVSFNPSRHSSSTCFQPSSCYTPCFSAKHIVLLVKCFIRLISLLLSHL